MQYHIYRHKSFFWISIQGKQAKSIYKKKNGGILKQFENNSAMNKFTNVMYVYQHKNYCIKISLPVFCPTYIKGISVTIYCKAELRKITV